MAHVFVVLIITILACAGTATLHAPQVVRIPDASGPGRLGPPWQFEVPVRVCCDAGGSVTSAAFDSIAWRESLGLRSDGPLGQDPKTVSETFRIQPWARGTDLEVQALRAARNGEYRPAMDGDRAVTGCVTVAVVFNRGKKGVAPEIVAMDPPNYPDLAREAGEQGIVLVSVLVNTSGLVKDGFIIQGVSRSVDDAAFTSAVSARFKPAQVDGEPVEVWMIIPIEFKLH